MKYPQKYEDGGIIILDDLNENEMTDPRIQAMFKRSRHDNSSFFKITHGYYKLRKRTIPAFGSIHHIFEPINCRDIQNIYQDKASIDMTLNEFKYLTYTSWNEIY